VVKVITVKSKILVVDVNQEFLCMIIEDGDDFFVSLRTIRNEVTSFYFNSFTVSPDDQFFNEFALFIIES
jgi:hypothetical protein